MSRRKVVIDLQVNLLPVRVVARGAGAKDTAAIGALSAANVPVAGGVEAVADLIVVGRRHLFIDLGHETGGVQIPPVRVPCGRRTGRARQAAVGESDIGTIRRNCCGEGGEVDRTENAYIAERV